MRSDAPILSVIIVSFNTQALTLRCLETLHAELEGISSEVFVVDNGSADGSGSAVRERFPQVRLIESRRNAGFGAANNAAMREARGRYFLLLNSDAFLRSGAVRALICCLKAKPGTAVVGPRLLNEDGSLQRSCFRFPRPLQAWAENLWISYLFPDSSAVGDFQRWAHDEEREVDFVSGACLLVRRDVYEQVGGFDEAFFLYAEETDWQRRIRDAGWEVVFTPTAEVTHLGGASGAGSSPRISRYFFRGLDLYERKHHGFGGFVSVRFAMIVGCSLRAALWAIVLLTVAKHRDLARAKVRLHIWLAFRQATCWNVAFGGGISV